MESLDAQQDCIFAPIIGAFNHIYFAKENDLNVFDLTHAPFLVETVYQDCVRSAFQELMGDLDIVRRGRTDTEEEPLTYHIDLKIAENRVLPILPLPLLRSKPHDNAVKAYELYQNGKFCDFTCIAQNGAPVRAHRLQIYLHGGAVMQSMLDSCNQDVHEQTIRLENFSEGAIRAYFDYLYLGDEAFAEKHFSYESIPQVNLYELIKMAYLFENESFKACCTNLVNQFSPKEDLPKILELAETYNDPHLREIADYYQLPENALKV